MDFLEEICQSSPKIIVYLAQDQPIFTIKKINPRAIFSG